MVWFNVKAASESSKADENHRSRELTKQAGFPLYVVNHNRTHALLGIDCPDWIIAKVTMDAEASAKRRQHAVDVKDKREKDASRALILRLFPYIPANSLNTILDHGFEKGSRRVGRTKTLDEIVKAKLAVNAHIRHSHTSYDSIYSAARVKNDGKNIKAYARAAVYEEVHGIADAWRTGYSNARETNLGSIAESPGPVPDANVALLGASAEVSTACPLAYAILEDVEDTAKHIRSNETRGCVRSSSPSTLNNGQVRRPARNKYRARQTATEAIQKARKIKPIPPTKP